jgi:hypothetical protein
MTTQSETFIWSKHLLYFRTSKTHNIITCFCLRVLTTTLAQYSHKRHLGWVAPSAYHVAIHHRHLTSLRILSLLRRPALLKKWVLQMVVASVMAKRAGGARCFLISLGASSSSRVHSHRPSARAPCAPLCSTSRSCFYQGI